MVIRNHSSSVLDTSLVLKLQKIFSILMSYFLSKNTKLCLNLVFKGELTNFLKFLLFLYIKHFKCIPLVFSHQNVFYLIKPPIVCSENKVLPKNLV